MRSKLVCGGEYSPMDLPALSFTCATCMENHCLTPVSNSTFPQGLGLGVLKHTLACLVFRGLRPLLARPTQPSQSLSYSLDFLLPNGLAHIEFCLCPMHGKHDFVICGPFSSCLIMWRC